MKQIFLHGLGQTPDSWDNVLSQLGADGHSLCPNLSELVKGKEDFFQLCNTMTELDFSQSFEECCS